MKTVIARSTMVVAFISMLGLSFTQPQSANLGRIVDLLIMAPRRKTLAQLASEELYGIDPSNLADFFRISPWDTIDLQDPLVRKLLDYAKAKNQGCTEPLFLIIDDSLANKDKGTTCLEAVDHFFDHKTKRNIKASNHISLSLSWGKFYFPLFHELYLRKKTIEKINRKRAKKGKKAKNKNFQPKPRLVFQTKMELAQKMLMQVKPYLPEGVVVYVLFDSWYTSAKLLRFIQQQQWHVIAGVKSNRKVNGKQVSDWDNDLKEQRIQPVRLTLANGSRRQYQTRSIEGHLEGFSENVRVIISKKDKGQKDPRYFLSTDTNLSNQEILQLYQNRWKIETDYWHLKMNLGLGDYRLQSFEAIGKWYSVVYLIFGYLYWRKYEEEQAHNCTVSLSEILTQSREEHYRATLRKACTLVASGDNTVEEVLEMFVGPEKTVA